MSSPSPLNLDYAIPKHGSRSFRPLIVVPPFTGGLITGGMLVCLICACGPPLTLSGVLDTDVDYMGLIVGLILYAAYPTFFIFLRCLLVRREPFPIPRKHAFILGMSFPAVAAGAGNLIGVTCDPVSAFARWGSAVLSLSILLLGIGAPLILLNWWTVGGLALRKWGRTLVLGMFFILIVSVAIEWAQMKAFDRNCERLAEWVKMTYPSPASHPVLPLPADFNSLAKDHVVDAVVLPDGRVVLVLKTALTGRGNWSGVIYSSGPILSKEIGTSPYGSEPALSIPDLPPHFITKQRDSQHFMADFNLG